MAEGHNGWETRETILRDHGERCEDLRFSGVIRTKFRWGLISTAFRLERTKTKAEGFKLAVELLLHALDLLVMLSAVLLDLLSEDF